MSTYKKLGKSSKMPAARAKLKWGNKKSRAQINESMRRNPLGHSVESKLGSKKLQSKKPRVQKTPGFGSSEFAVIDPPPDRSPKGKHKRVTKSGPGGRPKRYRVIRP